MSNVTNPSAASLTISTVTGYLNDVQMNLPGRMKPLTPPSATVAMNRISRSSAGKYVLVPLEPRVELVVSESLRPGRIWNGIDAHGPLVALASFFEGPGGEVFDKAPDAIVWEAGRRAAEASNLDGNTCRSLSRAIGSALGQRAGLKVATSAEMV